MATSRSSQRTQIIRRIAYIAPSRNARFAAHNGLNVVIAVCRKCAMSGNAAAQSRFFLDVTPELCLVFASNYCGALEEIWHDLTP
jgi:hypothetical protein